VTDLWGIAWPWLIALVLGLAVAIPIACWLMPWSRASRLIMLVTDAGANPMCWARPVVVTGRSRWASV